jgi:thiamine-phosphate pyrophosphorylase
LRRAPFSLYLITDRRLAKDGLAAACDQALAAAKSVRAGAAAVQLREKDLGARELYALGRQLRSICSRHGALLLINDRIDVALACGADGVHLPADSFAVADARRLMGPARLIGVSTHRPDETRAASEAGADFAVFGPVYDPISKAAYGPSTGPEMLSEACAASVIPVYALGGISAERMVELHGSGAAGVAVVGSVFGATAPGEATTLLLRALATHLA